MRIGRRCLLVLATGAAALAGCSSDASSDPASTVDSSTTSQTASPTLNGFWECSGTGQLAKVGIAGNGSTVGITWSLVSPITGENPGYYVMVGPYQIGLRDLPDDEVARFVANLHEGGQQNLTSAYILDGTTAQLVVPTSALIGVTAQSTFTATVTGNGRDLDTCVSAAPS